MCLVKRHRTHTNAGRGPEGRLQPHKPMPIYEYVCESCGHQLEARQKLSDAPLTECPSCCQARLERLVSASSFSLKGSGWYADGYGTQQPKSPSKSNNVPESKGSTRGGKTASSDTKSADTTQSTRKGDAAKTEKKARPARTENG